MPKFLQLLLYDQRSMKSTSIMIFKIAPMIVRYSTDYTKVHPPPLDASTKMVDAVRTRLDAFAKNSKRVYSTDRTRPDFSWTQTQFRLDASTKNSRRVHWLPWTRPGRKTNAPMLKGKSVHHEMQARPLNLLDASIGLKDRCKSCGYSSIQK